jgi:CDP-glycerol glycerophosphotransferase (TagB/SpsB family)
MFDKPVINVGYNPPSVDPGVISYRRYYDFDHYRPLVASGAVYLAESESQLREQLRAALAEPKQRSAERRALIEDMFGKTLDGHSGSRVIKHLLGLACGGGRF